MHRRNRRNDGVKNKSGDRSQSQDVEQLSPDSPLLKSFKQYASELDAKHDKNERIVKLSRDITIESKRIIFLLHTIDKEDKKESVLCEAEKRLTALESTLFKSVGKELLEEDPYMFLRAYTGGLQEYIEAKTFFNYLKCYQLEDCNSVQKKFLFSSDEKDDCLELHIPQSEYILGVADLTGELMRNCINSLVSGHFDRCSNTCALVKEIYKGFLSIGNSGPKEFSKKLYTLRQSLFKMENACYAIHVRGSEMPKNLLVDVLKDGGMSGGYGDGFEDDEGFY